MRIDEARQHRLSAQINFLRTAGGECQPFVVRSDREKSSARNRHGLRSCLARINCPEVSVVENEFRLGAVKGKKVGRKQCECCYGTHTENKLATRRWHLNSF